MITESVAQAYIPRGGDTQIAQEISQWTQRDHPLVVFRTPDALQSMYEQGNGMILRIGDSLVAHAAVTHKYEREGPFWRFRRRIYEVGTVVTAKKHQGKGYARMVVSSLVEEQVRKHREEREKLTLLERIAQGKLRREQYVALVLDTNRPSQKVFERIGRRVKPFELPHEVYAAESRQYIAHDVTPRVHRGLRRSKN